VYFGLDSRECLQYSTILSIFVFVQSIMFCDGCLVVRPRLNSITKNVNINSAFRTLIILKNRKKRDSLSTLIILLINDFFLSFIYYFKCNIHPRCIAPLINQGCNSKDYVKTPKNKRLKSFIPKSSYYKLPGSLL
jgi:hypothetical protein